MYMYHLEWKIMKVKKVIYCHDIAVHDLLPLNLFKIHKTKVPVNKILGTKLKMYCRVVMLRQVF